MHIWTNGKELLNWLVMVLNKYAHDYHPLKSKQEFCTMRYHVTGFWVHTCILKREVLYSLGLYLFCMECIWILLYRHMTCYPHKIPHNFHKCDKYIMWNPRGNLISSNCSHLLLWKITLQFIVYTIILTMLFSHIITGLIHTPQLNKTEKTCGDDLKRLYNCHQTTST